MEERLPQLPLLAFGWYLREDALRALRKRVRVRLESNPQPSALGSGQPVAEDATGVGGTERSYDGAKKIKGRKRHLLVDTQGLVLQVRVNSAKVMDREGIKLLLDSSSSDRLPRLSHLWLDAGYTGQDKGEQPGWKERSGLECRDRAPLTQACPRGEVMMRWALGSGPRRA